MQPPQDDSGRELFLVLEDLSKRIQHFRAQIIPLSQSSPASQILGVDVLYQTRQDIALLCLRFAPEGLDQESRAVLVDLATRAGLPVLDPDRLAHQDRLLFYQNYLRRYSMRIDDKRSPSSALNALGQLLGLIKLRAKSTPLPEADARAAPGPTRASTLVDASRDFETGRPTRAAADIPLVLATERDLAQGSESDCIVLDVADDEFDLIDDSDPDALTAIEDEPGGITVETLGSLGATFEAEDSDERTIYDEMGFGPAGNVDAPRGKGKRSQRMETIPARPANRAPGPTRASLPLPPPPPQVDRLAVRARHSGSPPIAANPLPANPEPAKRQVRVRFQRGDTWMPARLRNLTTKEVRMAASAAPPLGSSLRVAINIGEFGAVLVGLVVEVVNTERSVDGSTSFRIELRNLATRERKRLVELLRMAQREGVSLAPPPPRRNRRFAISWPVAVVAEGHRFNAAALDISERGLFLATTNQLRARDLLFGLRLDRLNITVQGSARVAREVNQAMAHDRGLSRGYGLHIEGLNEGDHKRFVNFLLRVRNRSQRHVMVAGAGERSHFLAECFQSAGYAVSKANTVETMMERNQFESTAPDIAVIDHQILEVGVREKFESVFRLHRVPILALEGQAPYVARDAADLMMSV